MRRLHLPGKDSKPIFNAPPATLVLCAVLVLSYGLFRALPSGGQEWALANLAFIPVWFLSQFHGGGVDVAGLLPLLSHVLFHADLTHLLVNVGLLLAFGSAVERNLGVARLLLVFVVSAIAGALILAWFVGPSPVLVMGASGAVYGLIGAAVPSLFGGLVGGRRRAALIFVAVMMGINVLLALLGQSGLIAAAEIAWQAHIGGFVAGLVLGTLLTGRLTGRGT